MEIKLRKAIQTDAQEIAQIHVNSWKAAFNGLMPEKYINSYTHSSRMEEWQEIIRTNAETVILAERDEKVVGFMSYSINPKLLETVELGKLYLCPSVYGQKLGSKFISHLEVDSKAQGIKAINLYVLNNNEAAIHFYYKHGFEFSEGYVSEEFEGTTIIDVLMSKRL